jgi:hypothetical protein
MLAAVPNILIATKEIRAIFTSTVQGENNGKSFKIS